MPGELTIGVRVAAITADDEAALAALLSKARGSRCGYPQGTGCAKCEAEAREFINALRPVEFVEPDIEKLGELHRWLVGEAALARRAAAASRARAAEHYSRNEDGRGGGYSQQALAEERKARQLEYFASLLSPTMERAS